MLVPTSEFIDGELELLGMTRAGGDWGFEKEGEFWSGEMTLERWVPGEGATAPGVPTLEFPP